MPFPGHGATPAPTGAADAPPPQQPPTQQGGWGQQQTTTPPPSPASAPAPAPDPIPPTSANLPDLYVNQNGQSVLIQGSQLANMPDTTQAHHNGQWTTLGAVRTSLGLTSAGGAPSPGPAPQGQQGGWSQPSSPQGGASPFAGIDNAQTPTARNPYLAPGKYVLHVVASTFNRGRDHNAQIIEVDILAADAMGPNPPTPEKVRATLYFKQNDSFLGNMKEIVIAASGFDANGNSRPRDSQITVAETEQWLNGEHPNIVGCLLYCEARETTTRSGTPFTVYNFWPCGSSGTGPDGKPTPDFASIPR